MHTPSLHCDRTVIGHGCVQVAHPPFLVVAAVWSPFTGSADEPSCLQLLLLLFLNYLSLMLYAPQLMLQQQQLLLCLLVVVLPLLLLLLFSLMLFWSHLMLRRTLIDEQLYLS
jgi:hypothetical protein